MPRDMVVLRKRWRTLIFEIGIGLYREMFYFCIDN